MTLRPYLLAPLASLLLAVLTVLPAGANPTLVPVHGVIIAVMPNGDPILRNDAIPGTLDPQSIEYHVVNGPKLSAGEQVDAFIDMTTNPWSLRHVHDANDFVAGDANARVTRILGVGDRLPDVPLVDQRGRLLRLGNTFGKTTIVSFIYTRCKDLGECPAVTAKFHYLQEQFGNGPFHLVEITIDPKYDTPAIIAAYAKKFDANPVRWSILTGEPSTVKTVGDDFNLSVVEDKPGNFLHNDVTLLVAPDGRIAQVIQTDAWPPKDVLAAARNLAGLSSSPLRRLNLWLMSGVIALCGGSQQVASGLLSLAWLVVGLGVFGYLFYWSARKIFIENV
ncbi:SCO family protein [bacterium]|nr:MAG: SCO family protein [bacterium]